MSFLGDCDAIAERIGSSKPWLFPGFILLAGTLRFRP